MPPCFRASPDGILIQVKVQPRSSSNRIAGLHGRELKIHLTAPPVDSAANEALVDFLADELSCSKGSILLLKGHASRHKIVLVRGRSAEETAAALGVPV